MDNNDTKFLIVKDNKSKQIKYFDYDKIDGYNLRAKKNANYFDDINVSRVIIINPSFSEKIARKKMNAKFERLLTMMQVVCEDDDTGEGLEIVLDEANKFKMELINKYRKYIEDEELELMYKKIEIVERELDLRRKAIEYTNGYGQYEEELTEGKSR
jgi:hypothetical protein